MYLVIRLRFISVCSESVQATLRAAKGNSAVPDGTSLLLPRPGEDAIFDAVRFFLYDCMGSVCVTFWFVH